MFQYAKQCWNTFSRGAEMQVDKIEMGTVIDHIDAGKAAKVMKLLGIGEEYSHRVAIVLNVPSKKMKLKDIVKIEGRVVSQENANLIALISPSVTVNAIKNGSIDRKYDVKPPEQVDGHGKCPNPNCISGEWIPSFRKDNKHYRCHYCERPFMAEEIIS